MRRGFLFLCVGLVQAFGIPDFSFAEDNFFPSALGGRDVVTYVGQKTYFKGRGIDPEGNVIYYAWDFNGDGRKDYGSSQSGEASFIYTKPGNYTARFEVSDASGHLSVDEVHVNVLRGSGAQSFVTKAAPVVYSSPNVAADGVVHRYAIMWNGGSEERYWNDVAFGYKMLTNGYGFLPGDIYLLNHDGLNPSDQNPDGMIDYAAGIKNLELVFSNVAARADSDDEVFVWVTDHGHGYAGEGEEFYGYLDGEASVDEGDEQDYVESDFQLRALFTGGNYLGDHGMDEFHVYYSGSYFYRQKFVSRFRNLNFEMLGTKTDRDLYIERIVDYLAGDTDKDGMIESGEVYDYDGDGVWPYEDGTGVYDEDDWGGLDSYDDNYNDLNTQVPGDEFMLFDANFDNHLDIDINYNGRRLDVDGTDVDNAGLFDGLDVNSDDDLSDWVSIDEISVLYADELTDDRLAELVATLPTPTVSFCMLQCYSGGFVEDLSAPQHTIATACEEERLSYGDTFIRNFTAALLGKSIEGYSVDADANDDGKVSMAESFNYAAGNDYNAEIPQYDDNGDGVGHTDPIPSGGDGMWGAGVFLK